jgi:hypothetical protein
VEGFQSYLPYLIVGFLQIVGVSGSSYEVGIQGTSLWGTVLETTGWEQDT